ncbi:MAG: hypothetical protein ACFB8W_01830 [Elainellaceae cyanobacterium]
MAFVKGSLRNTYLILTALLVLCFVLRFTVHEASWLKGFSLDVAAEIVGILLVVFSVDRVIDAEREQERRKLEAVAFQQMRKPLLRHLSGLLNLMQAARGKQVISGEPGRSLDELFDPEAIQRVAQFNLNQPAAIAGFDHISWLDYLLRECLQFRESLNRTVEKYSLFLQPEVIDLIEEMINSSFLWTVLQFPRPYSAEWGLSSLNLGNAVGSDDATPVTFSTNVSEALAEHVALFLRLVQFFNDNVSPNQQLDATEAGLVERTVTPARLALAEDTETAIAPPHHPATPPAPNGR